MMQRGSTRGLASQISIGISGIIAIGTFLYLFNLTNYPHSLTETIRLVSLFGFHLIGYHHFVPLQQVYDFPDLNAQFAYLMEIFLPSIARILVSAIFLFSVLLLLNSLTKLRKRSDENRTSGLRPRFLFAASLGLANAAMIINIISGAISLTLTGYSFEHWTGWLPWSVPPFHYELLDFGWVLIILEDVFGGIAMLLVAALFITNRKIVNADKPWPSKGMTSTGVVYTLAGVFAFTIHLAFVGVIMTIIAGIMGAIVFVGIKSAESLRGENTETG